MGARRAGGPDPPDGTAAVSVEGVSKRYSGSGDEPVTAVDGVSFEISGEEVVGLLGPNGAGKTTLIKTILGLVTPSAGDVRVYGHDVQGDSRRVSRHVSAVLEGARNVYWRLSVRENVDFFTSLQGNSPSSRTDENARLLSKFRMADKANEPVKNLSRGMQQKVSLACAFARQTPLLFLDEPTLGLDVEASYELRNELRSLATEESRTVVMSSHDMDVIEAVCDRVIILNDGEVVADQSVDELLDVFQTQSYTVTFDARNGSVETALERRFDAEVTTRGDQTVAELLLDSPDQLFDLIDVFRQTGVTPHAVTATEPDLEDVFLDLTQTEETTPKPEL